MTLQHPQRGLTLIELMVSSVIGLIALGAAGAVYLSGKTVYNNAEILGRLQENARFAATMIEDDLKHAGLYGLTASFANITGTAVSGNPLVAASNDCDSSNFWYLRLDVPIEAYNNVNPFSDTCLDAGDYVNGSDVLAIRRTSTVASATWNGGTPGYSDSAGQVFLRSEVGRGALFVAPTTPVGSFANWSDFQYAVRVYYVSDKDDIRTLRTRNLRNYGNNPTFISREISSDVVDFQLELGVDLDGDGSPDRFVEPPSASNTALFNSIVAVRYWLLTRAERREADLPMQTFTYAGKTVTSDDSFRRLLTSGTVFLRNAH